MDAPVLNNFDRFLRTLNPPAPIEPPPRVSFLNPTRSILDQELTRCLFQVPNPAGVFIIPSATGRVPPLNAYPMPILPENLVENPMSMEIPSSAPPLPPLPPSLTIEIPFLVDEGTDQGVGLSKQKTIRDLAMEAVTYNV